MKATIEFSFLHGEETEKELVKAGVNVDPETHTLAFENHPLQQLPRQGDVITKWVKDKYGFGELTGTVSFVHFFLDEDGSETYYINVDCNDED